MKLGQETAFPIVIPSANEQTEIGLGISKRFYAACAAMQGMIANAGSSSTENDAILIHISYQYADELLRQENDDSTV